MDLQRRIEQDEPGLGARARRDRPAGRPGRPGEQRRRSAATLLISPDWRCVWFDPVAAVFVHASYDEVVEAHGVDFAARHFRPEPGVRAARDGGLPGVGEGPAEPGVVRSRYGGPTASRPLVLLGIDHARRAGAGRPGRRRAWKLLGLFELLREPPPAAPVAAVPDAVRPGLRPLGRPRHVRAAAGAARPARRLHDAAMLLSRSAPRARAMTRGGGAGARPARRRSAADQRAVQATGTRGEAAAATIRCRGSDPDPPAPWENLSQLNQVVNGLLASGRAATAADYLDRASPAELGPGRRPTGSRRCGCTWAKPAAARSTLAEPSPRLPAGAATPGSRSRTWSKATSTRPASPSTRRSPPTPTCSRPDTASPSWNRTPAGRAERSPPPRKAVALAPTDVARSAAQGGRRTVTPYAISAIAGEKAGTDARLLAFTAHPIRPRSVLMWRGTAVIGSSAASYSRTT